MSISLVPVNLLFLFLGAVLIQFAAHSGESAIPEATDDLFPLIATGGYLPQVVGVFFIVGLVAAAYSSADSALDGADHLVYGGYPGGSAHGRAETDPDPQVGSPGNFGGPRFGDHAFQGHQR